MDETVVGTVNDTPTQLKCVSPSPESPVLESSQLNSLPLGSLLFTPGSADELSVIKLYAPLSVHQDDKEPLSSTSSSIANILDHYRTVSASCTAAKNTSPTTGSTDSHNNSSFFDNYLLHHPEALVVASSSVPSQKLVGFKDGTKLISSLANGKAKASTTNATRSPSPPGRLRSTSSPEIPASSSASNNIQAKAASFTKEEIDRISSIFSGTK